MTIKRTIEIRSWDHPFSSLTDDIRACFDANEKQAYEQGATFFKERASESGIRAIHKLLNKLDDDHPMFVTLTRTDPGSWHIWFGFSIISQMFQPYMRVARPNIVLPDSTPEELIAMHQNFAAFSDSIDQGGFMTTERMLQNASEHMMPHHDSTTADECYFFFDYANGDYAGWDASGRGILYNHEAGTVNRTSFRKLFKSVTAPMNRGPFSGMFT